MVRSNFGGRSAEIPTGVVPRGVVSTSSALSTACLVKSGAQGISATEPALPIRSSQNLLRPRLARACRPRFLV
jgi:hypothetical protein